MPFASPAAFGIAAAAAGCAAGGLACPAASRALLERKREDVARYWERRLAQYAEFLSEHGRDPGHAGDDLEKALAIWLDDAAAQAASGRLPRERFDAIAKLSPGFAERAEDPEELPGVEEAYRRYSGPVGPVATALSTAFMTLSLALVAQLSPSVPYAVLSAVTLALAAVMALCDWKAHIIPFELSYALVPAGALCQAALLIAGGTTALSIALGAALYVAVMMGSSWIVGKATGRKALGGGDVRSTPGMALICASSPLLALLASAATSLLVPVARLLLNSRGVLTTSTPFGPHLAVGAAAGLICPLLLGAWLPL